MSIEKIQRALEKLQDDLSQAQFNLGLALENLDEEAGLENASEDLSVVLAYLDGIEETAQHAYDDLNYLIASEDDQ